MANKGKYYESQFEEATIELLREAHWQYTFGDDIHRKYTDPLIEEDLRNFLAAQYKDKNLTTSEIDGVVANLRNTGMIDYHPYDTRIDGAHNINQQNCERIKQQCENRSSIKFAVISDTCWRN